MNGHTRILAAAILATFGYSSLVSAGAIVGGDGVTPEAEFELFPRLAGWAFSESAPLVYSSAALNAEMCAIWWSQPGNEALYQKFNCDISDGI